MKILFIILSNNAPSSRVRVLNLLPYLREKGIEFEVRPYPKGFVEKFKTFRSLRRFDIVFLQKKMPSPFESLLLKKASRYLVFDFDDAIYLKHDANKEIESKSRELKFKAIAKQADLIIAGNRILASEAGRFNRNVIIIPSAVPTLGIPLKDWSDEAGEVVIGWIGGAVNLGHLRLVEPVLKRLAKEYPIELRIICSEGIEMEGVKVRFIPWSIETQEAEIARFDIGIMPLPKTRHSEGKCGYKALQYMACGVPPVVSDVGINSEIVEHGKEGFVAGELEEFYRYLKILIENKEMRMEMGLRARQKVEKYYSLSVVADRLSDVLLSIKP